MIYATIAILFFAGMLLYFPIADHYNIIDHPNERSSHSVITIRGGGIIFLFAALAAVIMHPAYWLPVVALFMVGIISFIDDRITLSSKIRLLVHLAATTLFFIYLGVFYRPVYESLFLYFVVIGTINAYNFMDGINGITGCYSLVVLAGLQYVNLNLGFIEKDMIWLPMIACGVFLYFNFRKKARCFAGDVGSITIAFWIVMLLIKLILVTNNWSYILFLSVYGTDSVLTIMHRIWLKQNVFKPHRLHLYQIMANERKTPHLWVSFGYMLLQGGIIFFIVNNKSFTVTGLFAVVLIPLILIYIILKVALMKK
ncbi:MAG: glycosyltransferase family 4 protein [Bacteroidetes bacterium]|jgi:UDP-N-acetylmuramyl pentapeptide phosphotransferase/UDP-N-acetylglucosamine-1-phosphate transferase|nr:glycosyltransferase family 4 protein [Bacteroidota bacterium]